MKNGTIRTRNKTRDVHIRNPLPHDRTTEVYDLMDPESRLLFNREDIFVATWSPFMTQFILSIPFDFNVCFSYLKDFQTCMIWQYKSFSFISLI